MIVEALVQLGCGRQLLNKGRETRVMFTPPPPPPPPPPAGASGPHTTRDLSRLTQQPLRNILYARLVFHTKPVELRRINTRTERLAEATNRETVKTCSEKVQKKCDWVICQQMYWYVQSSPKNKQIHRGPEVTLLLGLYQLK